MLEQSRMLTQFIEQLTRINKGRAFFASPERLGEYILVDYVRNKRRGSRSRVSPPGGAERQRMPAWRSTAAWLPVDPLTRELIAAELDDHHDVERDLLCWSAARSARATRHRSDWWNTGGAQ